MWWHIMGVDRLGLWKRVLNKTAQLTKPARTSNHETNPIEPVECSAENVGFVLHFVEGVGY